MKTRWDWLLFVNIAIIGIVSILIISSISTSLAKTQLLFWLLGFSFFYIFSRIDFHRWQNYAYYFYFSIIPILLLLLFTGEPVRGSVRWIDLGFFRIQPSEIAKAGAILALAKFYKDRQISRFADLTAGLLIILPAVILIFIQPDLGNTLAFGAIWLGISTAAGMNFRQFLILFVTAAFCTFLFFETLAVYQKERLKSFINPSLDPIGTGYNIIQSKIAIGSGLVFGRGYGQGSQSQLKFLPEAESDFIFASAAEQLGLLGSAFLLVAFTFLIFRILSFLAVTDRFGQLIIVGIVSYFLVQFTVNVGMNMGLLPVTGITFPLVSYGGSSLIVNLFLLGIIFSIVRSSSAFEVKVK